MATINVILIDPDKLSVSVVEVENSFTSKGGMYEVMKCDCIEHAPIDFGNDDCLLVDEEGSFKSGINRFTIFGLQFLGRALIVGSKGENYASCKTNLDQILNHVKFAVDFSQN